MNKNKAQHPQQKGFTLIELMIVITIIAIIAAFAVPMFQNYTVRTRIAEGLVLAAPAKQIVMDNAMMAKGGSYSYGSMDEGWDGIEPTTNIQSIDINRDNGMIRIQGTAKANNLVLFLMPVDGFKANTTSGFGRDVPKHRIEWSCNMHSSITNTSQIPTECNKEWQKVGYD